MIPVEKQSRYEELVTALRWKYGNQQRVQLYYAYMETWVQLFDESLHEFATDLWLLVHLGYLEAPE